MKQEFNLSRITHVKKASKGEPYLEVIYKDGSKNVVCGVLTTFEKYGFLRPNRGVVLNPEFIKSIDIPNVYLKCGAGFQITRRRINDFNPKHTL